MLDLIGAALREKGLVFQRIDGQSSLSQRKEALKDFDSDPKCTVMLASIGAAGEGCVLTQLSTPPFYFVLIQGLELTSLPQIRFTLSSLIGTRWQKPKR
jgi:hypothetical protein